MRLGLSRYVRQNPPGEPFESTDPINGFQFLSEAYVATDPVYEGRVTVPVLWDKETKRIVNNSEDDICRMFNDAFDDFARNKAVDLFPERIEAEHAKLSRFHLRQCEQWRLQSGIRHAPAAIRVRLPQSSLQALDELEERLSKSRYLFSITALSKRTGDCFARSFGLTRFITAISNATCGASSIIRTCRVT